MSTKMDVPVKKRKTKRACNHCHKAHMTCDTGRPCQRCTLRGLEDSCQDAPRKTKKYLLDVPPNVLKVEPGYGEQPMSTPLQQSYTAPVGYLGGTLGPKGLDSAKSNGPVPIFPIQPSASLPSTNINGIDQANGILNGDTNGNVNVNVNGGMNNVNGNGNGNGKYNGNNITGINGSIEHGQPIINSNGGSVNGNGPQGFNSADVTFNPKRNSNFLSSAADLEYATLSSILQDHFGPNSATSNEATPNSMVSPAISPQFNNVKIEYKDGEFQQQLLLQTGGGGGVTMNQKLPSKLLHNGAYSDISPISNPNSFTSTIRCDERLNQYFIGPVDSNRLQIFPDVIAVLEQLKKDDPQAFQERNQKLNISLAIGVVSPENQFTQTVDSENSHPNLQYKEPEEIYENVKRPFSYTPGYHSLIAYLRKRFPKEMLVKMAKSMATYRPSFIATTNLLKEHDLIFMEQCFQRTLLTYDNYINVSGTPTIVWRRTGEIAYVADEFCMLTGWAREELMSITKKKFIVELLDDKSVVEYFELFLKIAFGDFLGATMTECTLLTPNPEVKIRTGCIWTLKRDVFGIPMMIIGNFLPIL